ncbi:MAG TPA: phosphatase PAP2 family protein [Bacteroidota bacterium]|nr:phosphatase PAP2 family protein [Bacteroidota bacterium]
MTEWLYQIDLAVFVFINTTLANPVGDFLWPLITDYDRILIVRLVLVSVWLWLIIRGGARGRTAAIMLIPVLFFADQLSSSLIKPWVDRLRPCYMENGVRVVQNLHLLVSCGPGKSFPSSHAVNNFAVATLFTFYYRRLWPYVYGWAAIVALSRVAVGVHYPSDILGGACIGTVVSLATILLWEKILDLFRKSRHTPSPGETT